MRPLQVADFIPAYTTGNRHSRGNFDTADVPSYFPSANQSIYFCRRTNKHIFGGAQQGFLSFPFDARARVCDYIIYSNDLFMFTTFHDLSLVLHLAITRAHTCSLPITVGFSYNTTHYHTKMLATAKVKHRPSLQWRHNERNGVSNRQPHDCLLNRLFRRRSKKTSKQPVIGLCAGWPVNCPHKGHVTRKMLPFFYVTNDNLNSHKTLYLILTDFNMPTVLYILHNIIMDILHTTAILFHYENFMIDYTTNKRSKAMWRSMFTFPQYTQFIHKVAVIHMHIYKPIL